MQQKTHFATVIKVCQHPVKMMNALRCVQSLLGGSLVHLYMPQTIGRLLGVCKNRCINEHESWGACWLPLFPKWFSAKLFMCFGCLLLYLLDLLRWVGVRAGVGWALGMSGMLFPPPRSMLWSAYNMAACPHSGKESTWMLLITNSLQWFCKKWRLMV